MLRISIYTTLIVILMLGAASAQANKQGGVPGVRGQPGYTNSLRTDAEKKNDREIVCASTTNEALRLVAPAAARPHPD